MWLFFNARLRLSSIWYWVYNLHFVYLARFSICSWLFRFSGIRLVFIINPSFVWLARHKEVGLLFTAICYSSGVSFGVSNLRSRWSSFRQKLSVRGYGFHLSGVRLSAFVYLALAGLLSPIRRSSVCFRLSGVCLLSFI